MAEKRRVTRINMVMVGKLLWNNTVLDCQLENLSMDGALIATRGDSAAGLDIGDECTLQLVQETDNLNLGIQAEVVHYLFPFVGLRFFGLDLRAYSMLEYLIQTERERQAFLGVCDNSRVSPPGSIS